MDILKRPFKRPGKPSKQEDADATGSSKRRGTVIRFRMADKHKSRLKRLVEAKYFRLVLAGVAVVLLALVVWIARSPSEGLKTYTVRNGRYNYSFLFYSDSSPLKLQDGSVAVKHGNSAVVSVRPVAVPLVKDCKDVGVGFTEAIRVRVGGVDTPICAKDNGFVGVFADSGDHHLMTVTFSTKQGDSIKPLLKTIYSSLTITQVSGYDTI